MYTTKGYLWLNGFRFLVGGPGAGKTVAIKFGHQIIEASGIKIPIAPQSVTKASFVDALSNPVNRTLMGLDAADPITQMTIWASEYSVLVGEHVGKDWLQFQCVLFDGDDYTETRRSIKESMVIKGPFVDMVAGVQPMRMKGQFPKEAWFEGFTSRSDFFFGEAIDQGIDAMLPVEPPRFDAQLKIHPLIRDVAHDLQCLHEHFAGKIGRQIKFTPEGEARLGQWYLKERKETEYTHPWLQDQNVRRFQKLVRDAALCCLARGETEYLIAPEDIETAWAITRPNEEKLVIMLDKIHRSDGADIVDQIYVWAIARVKETKFAIPHADLANYCGTRQNEVWKVDGMIKYLLDSGAMIAKKSHTTEQGVTHHFDLPVYYPNIKWKRN